MIFSKNELYNLQSRIFYLFVCFKYSEFDTPSIERWSLWSFLWIWAGEVMLFDFWGYAIKNDFIWFFLGVSLLQSIQLGSSRNHMERLHVGALAGDPSWSPT
jgi:hypothetical protein